MASLADRLSNTQDRETYSALMCYLNRLPPGDEFRQLAELLGLLSLVGQRIPDALADFLAEFRAQTKIATDYKGQVEARLANLPQEIATGIDPAAIAKTMSESFRQQLAASGLQDTAALLKAAVITLKTLSAELVTTLKPVTLTLSNETEKLLTTTRQLEEYNSRRLDQQSARRRLWPVTFGIVAFALGVFYGGIVERRHTADVLGNITARLQRIELSGRPNREISNKR